MNAKPDKTVRGHFNVIYVFEKNKNQTLWFHSLSSFEFNTEKISVY
jgi:hypothetical protein